VSGKRQIIKIVEHEKMLTTVRKQYSIAAITYKYLRACLELWMVVTLLVPKDPNRVTKGVTKPISPLVPLGGGTKGD